MRYISRFKNSIRASSVYSLAFMFVFALAANLTTYEEAHAQRSIQLIVDAPDPAELMETGTATTVTLSAEHVVIDEDLALPTEAITITVKLPVLEGMNPDYAITDTDGTDDGMVELTLTGASSNTVNFTITPRDDSVFEADRTISLTGEASGYVVLAAKIKLLDDDHQLELSVEPSTVNEDKGEQTVIVTANLTEDAPLATTVPLTISPASTSFYTLSATALSIQISAGSSSGTAKFNITPVDNDTYDGNQKIKVDLNDAQSNLALREAKEIVLADDESPPALDLSVSPSSIKEANGAQTVTVTAKLTDGVLLSSSTVVTVNIAANDDQYTLSTKVLAITIRAKRDSGSARLTITPEPDGTYERHMAIGLTGRATILDDVNISDTATVTLLDDDQEVTLSVSPATVKGAAAEVVITALLDRPARDASGFDVPITIGEANPSAYSLSAETDVGLSGNGLTITVPTGSSMRSVTVTVTPVDVYAAGNAQYNRDVEIGVDVADAGPLGRSAKITLKDSIDRPKLELAVTPETVMEEPAMDDDANTDGVQTELTITATLDGGTFQGDFGVVVEISEDDDFYTVSSKEVTLTPAGSSSGPWTGTVMVTPDPDSKFEAYQTISFSAKATEASPPDGSDAIELTASDTVQLQDNDHHVTLAVEPSSVTEEGGEQTVIVTAELTAPAPIATTVPVTLSPTTSSFYSLDAHVLSIQIGAGASSGTAKLNVTPVDNNTYNGTQKIKVDIADSSPLVLRATKEIAVTDDENLPVMSLSVDPDEITEAGGAQTVSVTAKLMDGVILSTPTVVTVKVVDDDEQYALSSKEFAITIPANQATMSANLLITPEPDGTYESHLGIGLSAEATIKDGDDDVKLSAATTVTLLDDDQEVTLSVSPATVKGEATDVVITATLDRPARGVNGLTVPVMIATGGSHSLTDEDGNAIANGLVNIVVPTSASAQSITVTVTPAGDYATGTGYNRDVGIDVTVTSASNLLGREATITLKDSIDLPKLELAVTPETVMEEPAMDDDANTDGVQTELTITATLEGGTFGTDFEVVVEISENEDFYTLSANEVTFTISANGTSGTGTVNITPDPDSKFEAYQTISFSAKATEDVTEDAIELTASDTVQLQDNDHHVTLSVEPSSVTEDGGEQTVIVTAELTAPAPIATTVPVTLSPTTSSFYSLDAHALAIQIGAGSSSGTAKLNVTPVDNDTYNGTQKIKVDIADSSPLVLRASKEIVVTDDENLPVMSLSVDPEEITEADGAQTVSVTAKLMDGVLLSTPTVVTVKVADDDEQYALSSKEFAITIPANQATMSANLVITPEPDGTYESHMGIGLSAEATIKDGDDDVKLSAAATVTLLDDDQEVTLSVTPGTVKGDATEVIITATLDRPARGNNGLTVPVMIGASGDSGYSWSAEGVTSPSPGDVVNIVVPTSASEQSMAVTITPTGDYATGTGYNRDVGIDVTVTSASNLLGREATITLKDSIDLPKLELAVTPETVMEEPAMDDDANTDGVQTELTITATLEGGTFGTDFEVVVEISENEDFYTLSANEVTFTISANGTSGTGTVNITPDPDSKFEAYQTISFSAKATEDVTEDAIELTASDTVQLQDNDHHVTLSVEPSSVTEDGGEQTVIVTAELTAPAPIATTVPLTLSPTTSSFYSLDAHALAIQIGAGSSTGTAKLNVTPVDNDTYNGTQKIKVDIADSSPLVLRASKEIAVTDDENLPVMSLSVDPEEINEADGAQSVSVTAKLMDGVLLQTPTVVTVKVADDDEQYALSSKEFAITIPANQESMSANLVITPIPDGAYEAHMGIGLSAEATIKDGDDDVKLSATATVKLLDDDQEITLAVSTATVKGKATDVAITAMLDRPARGTNGLTVPVMIGADGDDQYTLSSEGTPSLAPGGTVNIVVATGTSAKSVTVTVTPAETYVATDMNYDRDVGIDVTIADGTALLGRSTKITLNDSIDLPKLELAVTPDTVMEEPAVDADNDAANGVQTRLTIMATLDGGTFTNNFDIVVEVSQDTDFYSVSLEEVTLTGSANGPWTGTVDITPDPDSKFEAYQTISFSAEATEQNPPAGSDAIELTASDKVQLRDNDHHVTLAVDPASVNEEDGVQTVEVTAMLTAPAPVATTVPVTLSPATSSYYSLDAHALAIEIGAGSSEGTKELNITPVDNDTYNGTQKIKVDIADSSPLVLRGSKEISVIDDESLPVLALTVDPSEVNEGGGAQSVSVTAELVDGVVLQTPTIVTVKVDADDDQYALSSKEFAITIPANRDSRSADLIITPKSDGLFEAHMAIGLSAETTIKDGDDDVDLSAAATVTLLDDDHEVTLSVSPGEVSEVGGSFPVTVKARLNSPAKSDLTIPVEIETYDENANSHPIGFTVTDTDNTPNDGMVDISIAAGKSEASTTVMIAATYNADHTENAVINVTGGDIALSVRPTTILIRDYEQVSIQLLASHPSITEAGGLQTVEITAEITPNAIGDDVAISLAVGGQATLNEDFGVSGLLEIEIGAGSTEGSTELTFIPVDDFVNEFNETITVSGSTVGGHSVSSVSIVLADNNEIPLASISAPSVELSEADDAVTEIAVTATLAGTSGEPINVVLDINGSATAGVDYEVSGDLRFSINPGDSSYTANVAITVLDDALYEGNETVVIEASASLGDLELPNRSQPLRYMIIDNDSAPMIALSVDVETINEGDEATDVTITATASSASAVNIPITLAKPGTAVIGEDFMVSSEQEDFIIIAGETTATKVVTITPIDDEIYEGDEHFMVNGTVPGSDGEIDVDGTMITLTDNDDVPTVALTVEPDMIAEGSEVEFTITATPSHMSSMPITIVLDKSGGSATLGEDFEIVAATEGEYVIEAMDSSATKMVTLSAIADMLYEQEEIIVVGGMSMAGDSEGIAVMTDEITLTDGDPMPMVTLMADMESINENGEAVDVTVTAMLSGLSSMPITVELAKSGSATKGEDYTVTGEGAITVAAGDEMGMTILTIVPVDDDVYERDEMIVIGGTAGDEIAQAASITLVDDDPMPMVVLMTDVVSITENGGAQEVTVTATLSGLSSLPITVELAKSGSATKDEDYTVTGEGSITVAAGDEMGMTILTIAPVDDDVYERDEMIVIGGTAGDEIAQAASITLVDDETKPIVELMTDVVSITEDSGAQEVTVTATLSGLSSMPITVELAKSGSATKGEDYTVTGEGSITVAAGEEMGMTILTIAPVDDVVYERDEMIVIGGTAAGDEVATTASITLVDDETMPTIALSVDTDSVMEDGGDQEVVVTATASGLSSMPIDVVLAKSGTAIKGEDYTVTGDGTITVAALAIDGVTTLTITPVDDDVYENDETIVVGGEGVLESATVTLVDDETMPMFTLMADPSAVMENAGPTPVVVTATASGLSSMPMTLTLLPLPDQGTITIGEDAGVTGDLFITVVPGALEGSTTLTALVIDDDIYEGDEYVVIVGNIGDMVTPSITLTIIDDEMQPTVTLSLDPEAVEEGGGAQPFTVSGEASGRSSMDMTVMLGPLPTSTVTLGEDGIVDGTMSFVISALETEGSTTLTAVPADDDLYETTEYLVVGGSVNGVPTANAVTLAIMDNDSPDVALSVSPTAIREDGGAQTVTVEVVMSGIPVPVPTDISLALSGTAGNADYTMSGTPTLQIAAGETTASTQLTFAVVPDDIYEPSNETIVLTANWNATNIGSATINVIDDYAPPSVISALPAISLEAGDSRQMDVAGTFSGRVLVFAATSSDVGIATATLSGSALTIEGVRKGAARVTVTATNDASSASYDIDVTVTAIAAEREVYTDILAAMARSIMSSVSQTIGGRFSVGAAERQIALANRRVDGMAAGLEAMISLSGAQSTRKYGITDDTTNRLSRQPVSTRELMRGTSFYYALDDAPQGGTNGGLSFTIWGAGDWNAFEGAHDVGTSYDGTVTSGYLGIDVSKTASWIAGVAVGRTMGTSDYDVTVTDGTLEATLNSVYPYVHWTGPGCCIEIWAIGGFGTGEAEVSDGTSDLSMSLGMVGVRAQLVGAASGGLDLDLIGDAGMTKLSTADSESASLSDLEASVQRVRVGLEASRTSDMGNGMLVTPFAQVAGRYDAGDGDTGNGLEVAGGLRIAGGRAGLEARGRLLAMHTGEEVKEHGVSVVAYVRPMGAGGQGLSMAIAPRLGADTEMSSNIWREEPMNDVRSSSRSGVGMKAEIGYGLLTPMMSSIVVTPFGTMDMAGDDQRRMRLGARFGSIGDTTTVLRFELVGERIDGNGRATDHRIGLLGRMSF